MKTILIDDERKARENLRILLERFCPGEIELVGESDDVDNAFESIINLQPQLIFLDIDLGNASGFDLLSRFKHYPFKVIFVTAYDQYALKAIKFSALDYLLKPVSVIELRDAVEKAKKSIQQEKAIRYVIPPYVRDFPKKANRIAIPVQKGYHLVPVDEIMYCHAEKEYTFIKLAKGETICSSLNLGEYEILLHDYDFFRVHHSYIVNREYIEDYHKGDGGEILTTRQQRIPVSRRKRDEFLLWLRNNYDSSLPVIALFHHLLNQSLISQSGY